MLLLLPLLVAQVLLVLNDAQLTLLIGAGAVAHAGAGVNTTCLTIKPLQHEQHPTRSTRSGSGFAELPGHRHLLQRPYRFQVQLPVLPFVQRWPSCNPGQLQ